jgi:hypothetical protein
MALLAGLIACGPSSPSSTSGAGAGDGAKGTDMTVMRCEEVREAIGARRFADWRGLPPGCTAEELFGVPLDSSWGALPLGDGREQARSRLLELPGYYRPLAYARDGVVVAFDAMNPQLDGDPSALAESLGPPDATLDWIFGTVSMPGGEKVYAARGITLSLNPETQGVVYVTVYAPTTVESYLKRLRPPREKRPLRRP